MNLPVRTLLHRGLVVAGLGLLAACAPTAGSQLSISGAWVRATGTSPAEATEAAPATDATPTLESMGSMSGHTMGESDGMEMLQNSVSAVYLTIANAGTAADRLVSAATDIAGIVEIHTSEMDSQGVMRMRPLTDGLEIPPNGSVNLEPGGYHIMLMELNQPLMPGTTITLTLKFASGTTLEVEAEVRLP